MHRSRAMIDVHFRENISNLMTEIFDNPHECRLVGALVLLSKMSAQVFLN